MKLTKEKLKQIIKEEFEDVTSSTAEDTYVPKFTEYEMDDMSTDQQMVALLKEVVDQLKVLNHHMTPAKSISASGMEKAMAGAQVAEDKKG